MRAVVLLSGGLDSATCLALAQASGFECFALSFRYGQRHSVEIERAGELALAMGAAGQQIIDIDLRAFGGSALTQDIDVPKNRNLAVETAIPVTYVPARNTIFLSFAVAYAEVLGAQDIFIGVNAVDYSGYPDCRPEFIDAYERMANLATKAGVEGNRLSIHAPLIAMTKREIIGKGLELGVDYAMTSSCYDPSPNGEPCLQCDSCQIRTEAFEALGLRDPLLTRFERGD